MSKSTFVMHKVTGKTYEVATDTVQSRGRKQLIGMEIRHPAIERLAQSNLVEIPYEAARIAFHGERILRWKKKQSAADKAILLMYRAIKKSIMA